MKNINASPPEMYHSEIREKFRSFLDKNNLSKFCAEQKKLANFTTIKCGGKADFFFSPKKVSDLEKTFCFILQNNLPYKILGNGSNVLISDYPLKEIVISIKDIPRYLNIEGSFISISANCDINYLINRAKMQNLGGLSFLAGIPANIGGIIKMNAGAFNQNISTFIEIVEVITKNGRENIPAKEINFQYRNAEFPMKKFIIISAKLNLEKMDKEKINQNIIKHIAIRKEKQEFNKRTFGSVFRNGTDYYSAKLIEMCGLKGKSINGAQISTKHANFIINQNGASANDIYQLICLARNRVRHKFNIDLISEVEFWGDFENETYKDKDK
ncbi:MAG: UDP-N-acetylenolpyruvoylglucosamine reductase [Candidatus Cloacimonadota bacterium]|nr:MAG: UDP-N-acetylenolpyruvoylglucosamine reductase [Candidatus Cloacimonadota bacterium]